MAITKPLVIMHGWHAQDTATIYDLHESSAPRYEMYVTVFSIADT